MYLFNSELQLHTLAHGCHLRQLAGWFSVSLRPFVWLSLYLAVLCNPERACNKNKRCRWLTGDAFNNCGAPHLPSAAQW